MRQRWREAKSGARQIDLENEIRVRGAEPQESEIEITLSSLATATVVRTGVYQALNSRFDFWPVAMSEGPGADIGLAFDSDERPATPDTLVDIVRSVMALALWERSGTA